MFFSLNKLNLAMNKRIDYIDLAKGFCILLVVIIHTDGPLQRLSLFRMIGCFILPLFFFLSGMFFNKYTSFADFTVRKVNKLIVPFFFFMVVSYLIYCTGWLVKGRYDLIYSLPRDIVLALGIDHIYLNLSLWFFPALFETSLTFYVLIVISEKLAKSETIRNVMLGIMCFIIGIAGYELGINKINLPFWIDSSMSALPFFYSGYFSRKNANFLSPNKLDKYIPVFLLEFVVINYFIADNKMMIINADYGNYFSFYVSGIVGSMFILLLSKSLKLTSWLKDVSAISFYGRYCLIVLGLNWVVIYYLRKGLSFISNDWLLSMITFVLVLLLSIPIIKFLNRFFPQFVGEKDFIKIN